ncbi:hypothetical protein NPIL_391871 [Nephila pilipes]|uniref:Uncharacterized protein n=1 Tax=Nephila pilipes TaxID=299642 RepID=A0A8X6Q4P9_NEPPI|nr:hypothetical protein NPIL_391871 [Nephila pilipes]
MPGLGTALKAWVTAKNTRKCDPTNLIIPQIRIPIVTIQYRQLSADDKRMYAEMHDSFSHLDMHQIIKFLLVLRLLFEDSVTKCELRNTICE